MPNSEVRNDIKRARILAWWDKHDMKFIMLGLLICGMVIGAFCMSFIDRTERMAIMQQHDNAIRDFRVSCRKTIDERDDRANEAVKNATKVLEAAGSESPLVVPVKPIVKREPVIDLGTAVRNANKHIEQSK